MVELGFPQFTVEDFYDTFLDTLDKLKNTPADNLDQFLTSTFNDQGLSDYLVVFLRLLTSKHLQQNAEFFQNFIDSGKTVSEFCSTEVEPMYQESDNIHVSALVADSGVRIRIVYLDRGGDGLKTSVIDFPEPGSDPDIHLIYRPGHYDILYK